MATTIQSDIYNVVVTESPTQYNVVVTETPAQNVTVSDQGTPVILGSGVGIFTNRISYYSTDYKIAVKGLGEYTGVSEYKPIFTFEDSIQKTNINGYIHITGSNSYEPFKINNSSGDNIFKISTDELAIFKMHTTYKSPIEGALYFYNGDLLYGAS